MMTLLLAIGVRVDYSQRAITGMGHSCMCVCVLCTCASFFTTLCHGCPMRQTRQTGGSPIGQGLEGMADGSTHHQALAVTQNRQRIDSD